jgi:hypothetical protein
MTATSRDSSSSAECAVLGCTKPHRPSCPWCSMHEARIRRHGDPGVVLKRGHGWPKGEQNPTWVGDAITSYSAQHSRLRSIRGPASEHRCAECGGPAEQWAYRGDCGDERSTNGRLAWCPHLDCYWAMCRKHHRELDAATRRVRRKDPGQPLLF